MVCSSQSYQNKLDIRNSRRGSDTEGIVERVARAVYTDGGNRFAYVNWLEAQRRVHGFVNSKRFGEITRLSENLHNYLKDSAYLIGLSEHRSDYDNWMLALDLFAGEVLGWNDSASQVSAA